MENLNIFTVEKFIFLNPKAKRMLWKEFDEFFKEYIVLKQAGVDTALFSKLYMNFFIKFSQKNPEQYLDKIFGQGKVKFNYNFKKSLININLKLSNINLKLREVSRFKFNKVNLNYSYFKLINLKKNAKNIHEISRQYPNIICTRDKENLKVTLWR